MSRKGSGIFDLVKASWLRHSVEGAFAWRESNALRACPRPSQHSRSVVGAFVWLHNRLRASSCGCLPYMYKQRASHLPPSTLRFGRCITKVPRTLCTFVTTSLSWGRVRMTKNQPGNLFPGWFFACSLCLYKNIPPWGTEVFRGEARNREGFMPGYTIWKSSNL